jgi:excisionase family DNA binding protein
MPATATSLPESVDLRTASGRTGIAYSTLRQWVTEGRLAAYKLPNGRIRVRVDDLNALFTRYPSQGEI